MKAVIMFYKVILLIIFFLTSNQSFAQESEQESPQFIFPVACTYGEDCWPVNYVDVDPTKESAKDFKCRAKTYDDHKGTDFALASVAQMNKGVNVLAVAAGRVLRVRDGEDDNLKEDKELDAIKNSRKECGNGVLIDHGNGLQTMYCHLKKGSVLVKPEQKIKAGQEIAQVGQSGMAEFPHLHFGVFWEGAVIDPFTGEINTQGCGQYKQTFWHKGLPVGYEPVVIFDGGFRSVPPDFKAVQRGEENPEKISLSSAAFVFWAGFYNVEQGDEITLKIYDPDGNLFLERKEEQPSTRARQYYFGGRKIGNIQLKEGIYKAEASLFRQGTEKNEDVVRTKIFSVRVEAF